MTEHCGSRHLRSGGGPHPFDFPGATDHYAADRAVRPQHLRIEVELDFETKSLKGLCTTTLTAVREVEAVSFDAVDFDVEAVQVNGKAARFSNSGSAVRVYFEPKLAAEAKAEVAIRYRATPSRGLYFWGPDEGYPQRPQQAWTQGQDEDSRAWFPCLDAPAQKATTEVIATFPAAMVALSNGVVVADAVKGKQRTTHYKFDFPHSPYLVTLAVGEFEEATAQAGDTQLRYLFEKGRKEDALRCLGRTPQMVKVFEDFTGQKYPYGVYSQVFVTEFIFGGMENTSATTLTDVVLHDQRAHLDYSAESLISHELMHQWFGDLLTCRDWPHGWLNEGFATYGEVLWKQSSEGEDEADHYRKSQLDSYLEEAGGHYARPIVARKFHMPVELFDRHLYEKGGLVLHELRRRLGDALFFKAIRHYVAQNKWKSVETVDLARALEEATGHNLDRFFDQYVYAAGHPALKVEVRYEADQKRLRVKVKQTQKKEGEEGLVYRLPLPIRWVVNGQEQALDLEVGDLEHIFHLPCETEPTQARIDPRREVLATLEVDKPTGYWLEELKRAPEARARTEAAAALGKDGSQRAVEALSKAVGADPFWGTQAAAARALANIRTPAAKAALLERADVKHPKARRAVISSLGEFRRDAEAARVLKAVCQKGDQSYFVESEAGRAYGKLKAPDALEVLMAMTERRSFGEVVAVGAVDGIAESLDPKGYQAVEPLVRYGRPAQLRRAAAVALGKLAEPAQKKQEAVDTLAELLRDPQFRVQMGAFDAARVLGDRRLIGALESTPFLDGRAIRASRETVRALREGEPQAKEVAALREEMDRLKEETRSLKEKVEGMSLAKAGKKPAAAAKGSGRKPKARKGRR